MAFTIKKKRYKFAVDMSLDELTEVSYSKGIIFAKIRQLHGGAFTGVSKRVEVENHIVRYNAKFHFTCKMFASGSSCVLDACKCRISIRMEEKGGKHFRKLGFVDINLAEYAGAGLSTQRYILQAYDTSHRLDNSLLQVTLNITIREGDTIFQRPLTRRQPISLPEEDDGTASLNGPSILSKPTDLVKHSGLVKETGATTVPTVLDDVASHTRNSSATSQASAGYASSSGIPTTMTQLPGHSRQSSSGESSHGRNLSQGSSDTGFFGSMEKEKKRRKKLDEGRVDAELVINELMEGADLDKVCQDDAETSGLQLFVGKDGTYTFDKSSSRKGYEPVVITDNY